MDNRIRDIRRARSLTLADVAARCAPPTTAQTIGRLETGLRRLTLPWLERIAAALEVAPGELVAATARADLPVAALLGPAGAEAPVRPMALAPPLPEARSVGVTVTATQGDYRAGDELWCRMVAPEEFAELLNRDVLAPLPAGGFGFGRLVSVIGGHVRLLPAAPGGRLIEVRDPAWLAGVTTLIRRTA